MKLTYLFVFVNCFAANVFAQDKSTIPSISIPRTETSAPLNPSAVPEYSISKPFVPEKFKTAPKFEPISMDKPMELKPQTSDLNVGKQFADKMNKKYASESSGNVKFENIYFGEIKTKSEFIIVMYRDYSEVDSDYISVTVGESLVERQTMLGGGYKLNHVKLVAGKNSITFTALNEGLAPPNTAEFKILDDQNRVLYNSQWALKKDYKAIIDIIKE